MELKKYKLADIGKVITGKTPSTSIAENYAWGTIPFYTPEDVAKGLGMMRRNSRFISKTGFEEIANNTISGESVLVGCIGSDMGNVAYSNITCATNQQINAITQFKNGIDPLYVYYLLSTMKSYFQKIAGSTTTPILPKSVFEEIEIHLPDMKKQKDVVSILYALDRKIELNKLINDNLEAMAKQLYDYWFVQFDFPNEEEKPYKSSGGAMVWNEKLKRKIPEGWNVANVFDELSVQYGFPFSTELFTEDPTSIPVVRIRDILVNSVSAYSEEEVDEKYKLQKQDLLVGMDGNFHMNYWNDNVSYLNQRSVRLRAKSKSAVSIMQAKYDIAPYIKAKELRAKGSTVGHLSDKDLKELFVLVCPNINFRNKFDSILAEIIENRCEMIELTKQRDELLPLLMNGQASVNYHLSSFPHRSFGYSFAPTSTRL